MRSGLAGLTTIGIVVLALVVAAQATLSALNLAPVSAPEIDGSSLSAGLGVLAAGVLIVRSRTRSK